MDIPVVELSDPMMQRLFAYWHGKCRGDLLPGRRDIDPLDFPDLLPHISIFDVVHVDGIVRCRIRLMGTGNVQLMGADCTGQFFDAQMRPEDATRIMASYRQVIAERRPHFLRGSVAIPGREHVHYERLLLPLAADGRTVDMLLALFLPAETGHDND